MYLYIYIYTGKCRPLLPVTYCNLISKNQHSHVLSALTQPRLDSHGSFGVPDFPSISPALSHGPTACASLAGL